MLLSTGFAITPDAIARMAAAGGVGAVVLTHFAPSPENPGRY